MNNDLILGIDLGGTKCAACLARRDGAILDRTQMSTPKREGGAAVVAGLIEMARAMLDCVGSGTVVGIGVSAGAPADGRAGVIFDAPNLPSWNAGPGGLPLARILADALGGLSVALENDADATALAEHHFGAGVGASNMAFLTVGTGIGAGLILNGSLHRGATGAGGEIGHVAVEPGGRLCLCGLRGCLEAYASGPSIARVANERGFIGDTPAVLDAARRGEPAASFAVDQAARMLGRALATLTMLLNLERIVLGTLAIHAGDLLLPTIGEALRAHTWARLADAVMVVPAALGDRSQDLAAVCAFLAREESQRQVCCFRPSNFSL